MTTKRIESWIDEKKIEELEYALKHGTYKIREEAVLGLGKLKSERSLSVISALLDDDVRPVSCAAMNAIESIGLDSDLEKRIEGKKAFWKKEELREKESAKTFLTNKLPKSYSLERGSKKTLENAKQMLKKPMLGGKWF